MSKRVIFKIIGSIASLSIMLLLVSCGGGGGGGGSSTPTPTATTYTFFPDGFFDSGYSMSASLTGSDTAGGRYTANISMKIGSITTFNGEQAIPEEQIMNITNTVTKAFLTISSTGYYSDNPINPELLGIENNTNGSTSIASPAVALPQEVKIGDLGTVGTYVADDGSSVHETWQITDAGNGRAYRIISASSMDKNGNITGYLDTTEVMDQNHKVYSVTVRMYVVSNGITMTLSGNIN